MLEEYHAFLPYIRPECLMVYDDYEFFMTNIYPARFQAEEIKEILHLETEANHKRLWIQTWLDLLLQTYKVFILYTLEVPEEEVQKMEVNSIFSTQMQFSFNWLEIFLAKQTDDIWNTDEFNKNIRHRNIVYVNSDFRDCIIFACATMYYCPYLSDFFQNFHVDSMSSEAEFYNATKLIAAWKTIRMSFDITPKDLASPNTIKMIQLTNYLYHFLPNLSVSETIIFQTKLSGKDCKVITLENRNNYVIKYIILFFHDQYECFSVDTNSIVIPPRKSRKVVLTYFAKKMTKQTIYMLISGESFKYHFTKSKVFCVVGIPNLNEFYGQIRIKCPIYELEECQLKIVAPYPQKTDYVIHFTNITPDVDDIFLHHWKEVKKSMYPRRVNLINTILTCDETGLGTCYLCTSPMTPFRRIYYAFFSNEDVGDFSYKITIDVKQHMKYENINVPVPENFAMADCICLKERKDDCPKIITLNIPSRNYFLWRTFINTFMSYLGNQDEDFWQRYASNNITSIEFASLKVKYFLLQLQKCASILWRSLKTANRTCLQTSNTFSV